MVFMVIIFIDGGNQRKPQGAVVAVIVWWLDLQLPMQLMPITTDVMGLTPAQGEVYNIM
jgi:hypothetical protein